MLLQCSQAARQLAAAGRQLHSSSSLWASWRHGAASQGTSACSEQLLQQAASISWREKLVALSSLTIYTQGLLQHFASSPAGLAASSVTSLAAAAAATAAAPAGASLAYLQHRSSNSLGGWLRRANPLDGSATNALIAANVASYGMQLLQPGFADALVRVGYKVAAGEYWRLLTAGFVHGSLIHVGVNMLALYNIGGAVEGSLGRHNFLAVYLGSIVAGNLLGYTMGHSFTVSTGSSGALCGIFGGYLMHRFMNRHVMPMSRAEMVPIAQTLGINLLLMTAFGGMLDQWAHLGGFLGGAAITFIIGPRYRHRW